MRNTSSIYELIYLWCEQGNHSWKELSMSRMWDRAVLLALLLGMLLSSFLPCLHASRLAHRNDCLDKKLYPLLTHKHRVSTQKCAVCHVFIGRSVIKTEWMNRNDFFSNREGKFTSPDSLQVVHYQWPICSEWPVSLLWQVLPDAALRRSRQKAGRFPGLPLCRPWCI